MKLSLNCKALKNGLTLLYLLTLAACSTTETVSYQTLKPNRLMCPTHMMCEAPKGTVSTNADLVTMLDKSLNTIDVCQLIIESQKNCIEAYNKSIQK
ncbi:Rz1-like lysis system protein LysC [Actinobacillus equuli]|uniref:Rz1-like lysis system protein LysC n=1 Tax=Actinobacillus equuli TaxID=718 RepID=UPI003C6F62AD